MGAPRFRAAGPLRFAAIPPLVAVYHRASAQTHVVASPAPELLEAIADAWRTADEIMARLCDRFDMPDADADALTARLDELAAVGLIERA